MFPNAEGSTKSSGINTNNAFGTVSGVSGHNATTFTNGQSSGTHIFYAWKNVQGYFQADRYDSNNNADGPFIYTGFKPAFFMVKKTDATDDWRMFDNKRPGRNVIDDELKANNDDRS